jgi:putative ABC transport system permease protein
LVVFHGVVLTLLGIAIGGTAAFSLSRLLAGFLFGVTARDPAVFVAAPAILAAVALVAIWIPARRATRVSPMTLLRNN